MKLIISKFNHGAKNGASEEWMMLEIYLKICIISDMRIVEIGPGSYPTYEYSSVIRDRVNSGSSYIGVDWNTRHRDFIRNKVGEFIQGRLQRIPLGSDFADEVWLKDVFGDIYFDYDIEELQGKRSVHLVLSQGKDFHKAFHELARIVRPGGKIIIGELQTPRLRLLNRDYSHYGLVSEVFSGERSNEIGESYGIEPFIFNHINVNTGSKTPRGFFLVLTKPAREESSIAPRNGLESGI